MSVKLNSNTYTRVRTVIEGGGIRISMLQSIIRIIDSRHLYGEVFWTKRNHCHAGLSRKCVHSGLFSTFVKKFVFLVFHPVQLNVTDFTWRNVNSLYISSEFNQFYMISIVDKFYNASPTSLLNWKNTNINELSLKNLSEMSEYDCKFN